MQHQPIVNSGTAVAASNLSRCQCHQQSVRARSFSPLPNAKPEKKLGAKAGADIAESAPSDTRPLLKFCCQGYAAFETSLYFAFDFVNNARRHVTWQGGHGGL